MMSDVTIFQHHKCFVEKLFPNFVDSSEYDDKSRLYNIMNGGQRSNHSTVS